MKEYQVRERFYLLNLNIFVSITGFDYLKPGRRGCAILIFPLSYFFVMFWKIHNMRSQEQRNIASTEAEKKNQIKSGI